jgi:hypothetical protein
MEKIENLRDLANYLKDNISEKDLFSQENNEQNAYDNFQNGFESGYANSYANLLCLLDPEFKAKFDSENAKTTKPAE